MSSLKDQIAEKINGMLYLSESEAELQLLEWPDVKDVAGLQQKAAEDAGQSIVKVQTQPAAQFLQKLQSAADPADPAMTEYVRKYNDLFGLLQTELRDLTVVRAGQGTVHLYIGGFTDDSCLVVYTTAVET